MLYKQYGKFDVGKLKAITSMEAVMKYHIWEQEACQRLCIEQSMERGKSSVEDPEQLISCGEFPSKRFVIIFSFMIRVRCDNRNMLCCLGRTRHETEPGYEGILDTC